MVEELFSYKYLLKKVNGIDLLMLSFSAQFRKLWSICVCLYSPTTYFLINYLWYICSEKKKNRHCMENVISFNVLNAYWLIRFFPVIRGKKNCTHSIHIHFVLNLLLMCNFLEERNIYYKAIKLLFSYYMNYMCYW